MPKNNKTKASTPTPHQKATPPSAPAPVIAPLPVAPPPAAPSPLIFGAAGFVGGLFSGALVLFLGYPTPTPAPARPAVQAPAQHISTPAPQPKPEERPQLSLGFDPKARGLSRPNVHTDFNPDIEIPTIDNTAFIDPYASIIGNVQLGAHVYMGPFSSVRGDEGQPLHIGAESNLQDGVVIHALETIDHGKPKPENEYEVNGKRYAVYIGERVSLAHQSQVHGPAWVEDDVFLGMQALVFRAHVGKGCVIEPGAIILGVTIPPHRYVPAGKAITDQATADALPEITDAYPFHAIDKGVVHVNHNLSEAYSGRKAEE